MAEGGPAALVEFIAKAIVREPESVVVHEREGGRLLELETDPDDRGRVIGRQGRVAKAMRAVGAANGRNPIPIIIPCHRVIGRGGDLTGFGGGLETKAALLRLEAENSGLLG